MADIKIKNTAGVEVATISDNSINSTFDTTLIGENVEDYMIEIDNNFVKLLENFAGDVTPPKATTTSGKVEGQIWYDKINDRVNYKNSSEWTSNANTLDGKSLDSVREYTLSGLDTTGKLSKAGGTVTGEINVNGAIQVKKSIIPNTSDEVSLGGQNNRFRNIYLKENGIRLGDESNGLSFKPDNFVYVVSHDTDDVSSFPKGAIILNQETGEAIIKKSTGTFDKNNATFRKLVDDRQNSAIIGGNKFKFLGEIGLIAGGWTNSWSTATTNIEKIIITTLGNGSTFGNLTYGRWLMGSGMSSSVRGVFQGGWSNGHGSHNGYMDYVTFATPGNATTFGTIGYENYASSCVTDGVRGVIGSGYNAAGGGPSGHHYVANYITIATPGNASKFGSISQGYWGSAVSSGTRGVFCGYSQQGWNAKLEYITIQTLGNSNYFGSLVRSYGYGPVTVTDGNRGVFVGGWTTYTKIEYITMATTGNASDFGNCSSTEHGGGVSNGVRGCITNRYWSSTIDYITIATPSNTADFGSMNWTRFTPSSASGN